MEQQPAAAASVESAMEGLSLGAKQQPSEPGTSASTAVPAAEATEVEAVSDGGVADAKDQLIHTLTEELIKAKADLARISKERCVCVHANLESRRTTDQHIRTIL